MTYLRQMKRWEVIYQLDAQLRHVQHGSEFASCLKETKCPSKARRKIPTRLLYAPAEELKSLRTVYITEPYRKLVEDRWVCAMMVRSRSREH